MATHYSNPDLLDRDTFMRYGPFDPVRVSFSQRIEEETEHYEETGAEAKRVAYDEGYRDGKAAGEEFTQELEDEIEDLKRQLADAEEELRELQADKAA